MTTSVVGDESTRSYGPEIDDTDIAFESSGTHFDPLLFPVVAVMMAMAKSSNEGRSSRSTKSGD